MLVITKEVRDEKQSARILGYAFFSSQYYSAKGLLLLEIIIII